MQDSSNVPPRKIAAMNFPLELEREIFEFAAWSSSKAGQLRLMLVARKTQHWYVNIVCVAMIFLTDREGSSVYSMKLLS